MIEYESKIRLLKELRGQGIADPDVLSAIERVPREMFVPEAFRSRANDNDALPIGHGQTISQPVVVAYMTGQLELGGRMKVLEIGTGSGYQAAVLSTLCRRVYTIERYRALLRQAERRFDELRFSNITTRWDDGSRGWPEVAPFERIIVTAAAADVPPVLLNQLAPDGVMILPVGGDDEDQQLLKCRKRGEDVHYETLWPVRFVPLLADTVDDSGR
ncbi:MAG: protein-L-isoaspartate(D-aspartate) O-methyltransferase [Defluviicoccus sp.]|nr:protein-L-isoaspartate(D-aspartate) O-methyltransferase [Defluviicoccus sp.]MDE0277575.1 protein-L-isoaspartate(D-aspartate) O-methyltransferase [Defluviicoccus sp.]